MKKHLSSHRAPGRTRTVVILIASLTSLLLPALWYVNTDGKPPARNARDPQASGQQAADQNVNPNEQQQPYHWNQTQNDQWTDQQNQLSHQQQQQYQQYEADHRAWEQEQIRRQQEQDNLRIQEESRRMQEQQRLYQQQQEQQRQLQQRGY